jgi:hypothetical protein
MASAVAAIGRISPPRCGVGRAEAAATRFAKRGLFFDFEFRVTAASDREFGILTEHRPSIVCERQSSNIYYHKLTWTKRLQNCVVYTKRGGLKLFSSSGRASHRFDARSKLTQVTE